ncbi:hypothetical protein [Fodinicurvata sp. EGI_FJ10296]|uniref:hypothetical protein n=1 Tax=Fodinicurvata sp. EGI_FJ10296 TaxID=3231908 RepID=UPI0034537349
MTTSTNPGTTVLKAFAVAIGIAGAVSIAGHFAVQPGHDAWQADLAAAQRDAAEARAAAQAEAEAQAAAEAEAEAARRAEDRRQQAQQALSRSLGSPAGPSVSGGGFNPLAPGGGTGSSSNAGYDGPRNPDFGNLPDTEGVETVYYNCTSCHSATVFTQQRMTRDRWDYTLDWMVTHGGMAELPDADRATVLDYLVRHFSS